MSYDIYKNDKQQVNWQKKGKKNSSVFFSHMLGIVDLPRNKINSFIILCQWCHSRVIYAFTLWMLVLKVREHVLQYCNNLLNVIFFPTVVLFGHRSVFPLLFNSVVIDYWWRLPLTFRLYFRESRQRKVSFPFAKYVPFVHWHF